MPIGHEDGATAVEYALIAGLIAVVIAVAVALLGQAVLGSFEGFNSTLEDCRADGTC